MPKADEEKIRVHPKFDFTDADFTIRIQPQGWPLDTIIDFKVHKSKLAAASPVFADMLALGEGQVAPSSGASGTYDPASLSKEIVEFKGANAKVWVVLLGSIYNDFDLLPESALDPSALPLHSLLWLWSASHKFNLVTLFRLIGAKLRYVLLRDTASNR